MYRFFVCFSAFAAMSFAAQSPAAGNSRRDSASQQQQSQSSSQQSINQSATDQQESPHPNSNQQPNAGQQSSNANPNVNSNYLSQQPNNQSQSSNSGLNAMQNSKAKSSHEVDVLLNCTNQARKAVRSGDRAKAEQDVNQALMAAHQLRSQGMVPLYSELDEYSVLGPIAESRAATQNQSESNDQFNNQPNSASNGTAYNSAQANQNSQTYNNQQTYTNAQAHQNRQGRAIAVKSVLGDFTSVDLNARLARIHLNAAKQALQSGRLQTANQDLKAVQDGVVLVSVGGDMPLLRTRENLILARLDAQHGQYRKAQADLTAACRSLKSFQEEGGPNASQARNLRHEIAQYEQTLPNSHAHAASKIESFWNQSTTLATPMNTTGANG